MLTEWVDVWKKPQQVSDDHLIATIEALTGRDLGREERIKGAILDLTNDRPLVEPVLVAWDGHLDPVETAYPVSSASLVTESGNEVPVAIDGNRLLIEGPLPLGYHELHVSRAEHPTTVISAPVRAHEAPLSALGVSAPVYAMRSAEADSGVGTYSHLEQLADLGLVTGAAVVGTLPIVATFPDQPSPYAPASRRAWNELFIDLTRAPGWTGEVPRYSGDPLWVDYDGAAADVRSALAGYTASVAEMPQIMSQIEAFGAANPEMVRYAGFRATCDRYGRNWRAWPDGAKGYPDRFQYHLTAQWLATEQLIDLGECLTDRGQYLYLDLPIGCHPDGYDIWDQPDLYAPASVGAPPDSLFLGGQEWGLPAIIPANARRNGHVTFRKAVRHQLSVAGLLRIDHIMGLHRAWWVPRGLKATDGAYVLQPTDEMFAIICLESHRAGAAVIGENLGTVPVEISEALETHGLLGMKVAQDGLVEPGPDELIALSTHDSPPFAAWWKCTDIDDGEDLGVYADGRGDIARQDRNETTDYLQELLSTDGLEETRDAILEWMARSEAAIAVANLDDLWAEDRRQNVPGTDTERPNWRARHRIPLDEVARDHRILAFLERLGELRKETQDGSTESNTDNG
ncbi:MAG: 4-alpha-glucanotransferase [Acidimicrobiia bacterium]|nr:4-alpha-glucanotransferase [Acidimicrobiia bacterium]